MIMAVDHKSPNTRPLYMYSEHGIGSITNTGVSRLKTIKMIWENVIEKELQQKYI